MKQGDAVRVLARARVWLLGFLVYAALLDILNIDTSGDSSKSGTAWCRSVGALALFFAVVSILRTLWLMRVSRSDPYKLIAGGKTYRVNTFTGRVHSASTSHISRTTGSGSISTDAMGHVSGQLSVDTTTTRLDQFSLTNASGQQHSVEVKGAHVALGEGQLVTAAWGIPVGNKTGKYFVFVNHSTGTTTWAPFGLGRMALGGRPGIAVIWAFATGVLLTLGGYDVGLVIMGIDLVCLALVSRIQMRVFRHVTATPLLAALKAQGAAAPAPASRPQPALAVPTGAAAVPPSPPAPTSLPAPSVPAGWLADPGGRHELRYWDGGRWTDHASDAGVAVVDPA
jgi:hypothetical protein